MIIIGISAKKLGGKSTLVDYLLEKIPQSSVVRFADSLKKIIIDCFIPREWSIKCPDDLDLDEVKNKTLPCGKTIRELLQLIGTDWFRHTWEDCWVNSYKKKIFDLGSYTSRNEPTVVFTPDVRFPNELKSIQEMGGSVIRLLRAPFGDQDQHESETALDEFEGKSLESTRKGPNISHQIDEFNTLIFSKEPGRYFNLIYDNREKSLEDTKRWVDEEFIKCFKWQSEIEAVSNMSFDLGRMLK